MGKFYIRTWSKH